MCVCNLQQLVSLVVIGLIGFAVRLDSAAQQPGKDGPRTRIVLLGTGTPAADPERFGAATAVVVNDTAYLVDAGAGRRMPAQEAAVRTLAGRDAVNGYCSVGFLVLSIETDESRGAHGNDSIPKQIPDFAF